MTPYHAIRKLYVDNPGRMTWEELVGWHLAEPTAHVYKGPDFFVMGRAVVKAAPPRMIRDLTTRFPASTCDAWYVFAFAGHMSAVWRTVPYHLPWICFDRFDRPANNLRWLATSRFRGLTNSTWAPNPDSVSSSGSTTRPSS